MSKVRIPFLRDFKQLMLDGHKTMTSRNKWYGYIGDTFDAFGATFTITDQFLEILANVASDYFADEGFESPRHFVACWEKLHHRKGYVPEQVVKVHVFERVEEVKPC